MRRLLDLGWTCEFTPAHWLKNVVLCLERQTAEKRRLAFASSQNSSIDPGSRPRPLPQFNSKPNLAHKLFIYWSKLKCLHWSPMINTHQSIHLLADLVDRYSPTFSWGVFDRIVDWHDRLIYPQKCWSLTRVIDKPNQNLTPFHPVSFVSEQFVLVCGHFPLLRSSILFSKSSGFYFWDFPPITFLCSNLAPSVSSSRIFSRYRYMMETRVSQNQENDISFCISQVLTVRLESSNGIEDECGYTVPDVG